MVENILSFQIFQILGEHVQIDRHHRNVMCHVMPHVWVLGKEGGAFFKGDLGEYYFIFLIGFGQKPHGQWQTLI